MKKSTEYINFENSEKVRNAYRRVHKLKKNNNLSKEMQQISLRLFNMWYDGVSLVVSARSRCATLTKMDAELKRIEKTPKPNGFCKQTDML